MIYSCASAARRGTASLCRKIRDALTSWRLVSSLPPVTVFAPYIAVAALKLTGALA